jgi:hypothetical protein
MLRFMSKVLCGVLASTCAAGSDGNLAMSSSSLEMRWFFKNDVPKAVRQWFEQSGRLGGPVSEAERDRRPDLYFLAGGDTSFGLKLRSGDLELKKRQSSKDVLFAAGRMSGRAEVWNKWGWSHRNDTGQTVFASFDDNQLKGARLPVLKDRAQRKFKLGEKGEFLATSLRTRLDVGCLVELTSLTVVGKQFWTVAVELFGLEDVNELQRFADWVFQDYPGTPLHLGESYSYPAWLLSLVDK